MATLTTPVLDLVKVFDANYAHTFSFSYSGNQAVKNRLLIKDNVSNQIVYNQVQDGLRLNHTIGANVLENNKVYNIQVQVYDADGNSSNLSNLCIFSCHSTPQFYFSNVANDSVISNANLSCNLTFLQEEGDSVKEYRYYLYDSNKSQLLTSDYFYDLSAPYTYYGLENVTTYYIRAVGTTVFGFEVDTGYLMINVKYVFIPTNIAFSALNKDGKIILTSNIVLTDYDLDNESYQLENGELTLTENAITYHILDFIEDFSLVVRARHLPLNSDFVTVICEKGSTKLSIHKISEKYYCKLTAVSGCQSYVTYKEISGQILGTTENEILSDREQNGIETVTGAYNDTVLIVFEIHKHHNLYSLKTYYQ